MENEINLLKNNDRRTDTDLEWVIEFYNFLQGDVPKSITISKHCIPKMSAKKAMSIIWYLQEHFPLIPDNIEMCSKCHNLFDSNADGHYCDKKHDHFCDSCYEYYPQ